MKTQRMRLLVVAALTVLPILAIGGASANECPPLDPTCVVDETVEGGGGVVDDTVGTVTDTVGTVTDTVGNGGEDTLNDVSKTIDGVVDPVPDDGGGGSGGGTGGNGDGPGNVDDRGAGRTRRDVGSTGRGVVIGSSAAVGTGPSASDTSSLVPVAHHLREGGGFSERLSAVVTGAAKSLAVVFALMGAAIAFTLVQGQLDKADPRLALAPMRSEVVRFE
jgi:hypothetical protein